MWIHGIRDKTFPFPVPQLKKNYKNGTLTKNTSRDEELARQSLILTVTGCKRTQAHLKQLTVRGESSVFWMGDSKVLGSRFCDGE